MEFHMFCMRWIVETYIMYCQAKKMSAVENKNQKQKFAIKLYILRIFTLEKLCCMRRSSHREMRPHTVCSIYVLSTGHLKHAKQIFFFFLTRTKCKWIERNAKKIFNLKIIIGWNWPRTIIKQTMKVDLVKMNDSQVNWPILRNSKRYKLNFCRTKTLFAQFKSDVFLAGSAKSEHRIGIYELLYSALSMLWNEIE